MVICGDLNNLNNKPHIDSHKLPFYKQQNFLQHILAFMSGEKCKNYIFNKCPHFFFLMRKTEVSKFTNSETKLLLVCLETFINTWLCTHTHNIITM